MQYPAPLLNIAVLYPAVSCSYIGAGFRRRPFVAGCSRYVSGVAGYEDDLSR